MPIVPFKRLARYMPRCKSCGARFDQRHPSHEYCLRCYRGAQLHRALVKYRQVPR
jgi:hypothetical protein